MPHDIKGRKLDEGDVVLAKHWCHGNKNVPCLIQGINEGSDTYNLMVTSVKSPNLPTQTVTAKEVELLAKSDGTKPE